MNNTSTTSRALGVVPLALAAVLALFALDGAARASRASDPSAAEFGAIFVDTANQYARDHHDPARLSRPDCVRAAPGRYMCSYVVLKPGAPEECHLMQARWTPEAASTITVTLAGRTTTCRSLRDALESLR